MLRCCCAVAAQHKHNRSTTKRQEQIQKSESLIRKSCFTAGALSKGGWMRGANSLDSVESIQEADCPATVGRISKVAVTRQIVRRHPATDKWSKSSACIRIHQTAPGDFDPGQPWSIRQTVSAELAPARRGGFCRQCLKNRPGAPRLWPLSAFRVWV